MAPATILQLIPNLDAGGAERSAAEVSEAVVAAGGRSFVVSEGGRLASYVEAAGGENVWLPVSSKNPFRMTFNALKLIGMIRREKVSLVHARSRAPAWSGLLAARVCGVPFVTTYHGAYNQRSSIKGFYNGVMARGDEVIANSKFTARLIQGRHKVEDERLKVIYRGVDIETLDPLRVENARIVSLRKKWDLGDNDKVVLLPARLTEWKGQRDLIEAARILKDKGLQDAVFILAGDAQGRTQYKADLEEMIAAGDIKSDVRIVGHVDDMAAAYCIADIVVVASREAEAFGRVAAEAQAMGCPVIATDIGAPPEFLNLGYSNERATAWLVPVADALALANRIKEIFDLDATDLTEMAGIARRYIAANFTAESMKSETIDVYEQLLGGPLATIGGK